MNVSLSRYFRSSSGSCTSTANRSSVWFLVLVLLALACAAYLWIHLDHSWFIGTNSRALYVDEGFYTDAAQNFAKFGQWGFPYDFPHWAGAPFYAFVQTVTFVMFGASLETARLTSTFFALASVTAFYGIIRTAMHPPAALLLTVPGLLTINFVTHARSALAEPTAVCLSLLALLVVVRVRPRCWAIPLSVALGFAAFLSKMYFLFSLAAVVGFWLLELLVIPALKRERIDKASLVLLSASAVAAIAFFMLYLYVFGERISAYYAINSDKIPWMDLGFLIDSITLTLSLLPFNTKVHVYLAIIVVTALSAIYLLLRPDSRMGVLSTMRDMRYAGLVLGLWLLGGLATVCVLNTPKSHYFYFSILPLVFLAGMGLRIVLPYRFHTSAIGIAALLHVLFQVDFYERWWERDPNMAMSNASRDIARIVEGSTDDNMIPVIGEYAAELGLFSDRIFSLDVKWSPYRPYCERINHWRPAFHVNVVWPGSISQKETDRIERCKFVVGTKEINRYPIVLRDDIVLSGIQYK